VPRRLILASASPARRQLLEWAGLAPEVIASEVAEDGVDDLVAKDAVVELARRKAREVAASVSARSSAVAGRVGLSGEPALVVACDSMLEFEGETWGKPASRAEAAIRWRRMRGGAGLLHTGHCVIDTATGHEASTVDTALVRFGTPTDREVDAYVNTDEAVQVAGPFTLEGLSAPWIDSIDGNYGTITGISLPVLRRLLLELDVEIIDLWS
jgi:septum formation protein